jgi:hypothetical protein
VDDLYRRAEEGTEVEDWLKRTVATIRGPGVGEVVTRDVEGSEVEDWLRERDVEGTAVEDWL